MKDSAVIWVLIAALLLMGLALTGTLHTRASIMECAKGSGWLSDADCRVMCGGRVK